MKTQHHHLSGWHDRRGFETLLKLCLALMVVSLFVLVFFRYWTLGLSMFFCSAIYFITLESISAPPANRPDVFVPWARRQTHRRRPVLLCLGDSLTHGNCSSSFIPEIPIKLCEQLGMQDTTTSSAQPASFADPLWVVNAGQNGITSYTILHERLHRALSCHPDYVLILIGTNDVRAMYKPSWSRNIMRMNSLPEPPNLQNYEHHLTQIVQFIRQSSSPMVQIGLCQLPPLGEEDLNSTANEFVKQANAVIARVAAQAEDPKRTAVIPLFDRLQDVLEKKKKKRRRRSSLFSVDYFVLLSAWMNPLFHLCGFLFSWNMLSALVGNVVLSDGVHLNDTGRDVLVDCIVEWLLHKNVAKAIAVKM